MYSQLRGKVPIDQGLKQKPPGRVLRLNLLPQQLNFKLFGLPYLVGIIKFDLFSPWLLEK